MANTQESFKEKLSADLLSRNLYTRKIAFRLLEKTKDLKDEEKLDLLRNMLAREKDRTLLDKVRLSYNRLKAEAGPFPVSQVNESNADFVNLNSENKINYLVKNVEENLEHKRSIVLENIKHEKDVFVIATMISVLARYGNERDIGLICRYLEHEDARVRANSVDALRMIADESVYRQVLPLLSDSDARVRANVARFLTTGGSFGAIRVLKEMIYSNDKAQIKSALFALEHVHHPLCEDLIQKAHQQLNQ